MATVSVVVPVYRVEKYLPACIESILNQTYQDLELILVDDGSPDSCGAICDEYAGRDSRIRVIHKENGGVSSARNAALEIIAGQYVTFCDSDDQYTANWIEMLLTAIQQHDADVTIGNYVEVQEDGTQGWRSQHETGTYVLSSKQDQIAYCIHKILGYQHGCECCMRLFRADIIERNKIRFCETCGNFAEDMCFCLEYTLYTQKVVSLPVIGYLYTMRGNSMMHSSIHAIKLDALNEVSMQFLGRMYKELSQNEADSFAPVLHYCIMATEYEKMVFGDLDCDIRDSVKRIRDRKHWRNNTIRIFLRWKKLKTISGVYAARSAWVLSYCFLFGDKWMFLFWRKRMSRPD